MRNSTHELSSSDRFGKFHHWFRMPLAKVEHRADMFINRGYVKPARSLMHRAEFRERTELLIMSALYLLGRGTAYCSCRVLCHICMLEI